MTKPLRKYRQLIREAMRDSGNDNQLPAVGLCHYCGHDVKGMQRFCGTECHNRWVQESEDV